MRVVIVGGGGHASDVVGVIEDLNRAGAEPHQISIAGLLDDSEIDERRFRDRGVRQVGALSDLPAVDASHFFIGIGKPRSRRAVHQSLNVDGKNPATLIHPAAALGTGVEVGVGTVIFGGARLSPLCSVGSFALVGNAAIIGHDCIVGDFSSIMPSATLSGETTVGAGCLVGTNACVIETITIGDDAVVGAGAAVITDVHSGRTVVGVPAKPMSDK